MSQAPFLLNPFLRRKGNPALYRYTGFPCVEWKCGKSQAGPEAGTVADKE